MEERLDENEYAHGIPDMDFIRSEKIPMTKEEIRTLTLSKARILPDSIVYDVGAGTGSISIGAALMASRGKVYSIEKNPVAITTIKQNLRRFKISNCNVVEGEAPESLENLPDAHRIIIGGSGGRLKEILSICKTKLINNGIIVINSVTIKTLEIAIECLQDQKPEVIQVQISKLDLKTGILKGQNPVFIVSAKIRNEEMK